MGENGEASRADSGLEEELETLSPMSLPFSGKEQEQDGLRLAPGAAHPAPLSSELGPRLLFTTEGMAFSNQSDQRHCDNDELASKQEAEVPSGALHITISCPKQR